MYEPVHRKMSALLAAVVGLWASAAAAQTVLYVDQDAPGANDGTSWADAFTDLQDALGQANTNGVIAQIQVAAGTYKPDRGTGDRQATFQLLDGVAIMGGYGGYGAPDPDARDFLLYETILSGEITGHNTYHVVTGNGTNATAVLDGFTIIGGDGFAGSGMYNIAGSPTVRNCKFIGNQAERYGGGMCNEHSNPTLLSCVFSGNTADWEGGGMCNYHSSPTVTNCTFAGNEAGYDYGHGGGIYSDYANPVLTNCIFWGNASGSYWDSIEEEQIYDRNGAPNVNHSCIEGWSGLWGGTGNFGDDPLFVDADGADGYAGTLDDDLHLAPGSPCINVGDNDAVDLSEHDFDGDARTRQCRVDVGADETDLFLADCNSNAVADACDLTAGTSEDCNNNAVPDECEPDEDCNTNGIQDICELTGHDWNHNGIPDACDIAAGTSTDLDGDGIPDESVRYVDVDAVGANDGSSWADAYTNLRSAISATCGSGVVSQVRVAAGTYKPTTGTDREVSFELCNGLAIMGGYAGYGEPDPDARDIKLYETILSGDLNDDDQGAANREDNSYHVISNVELYSSTYSYAYLDASAILDGVTIAGGNAPGTYWRHGGGGVQLGYGSPTIRRCTFRSSTAEWDGGGLCTYYGRPTLVNCKFIDNQAAHDGGGVCNHEGHVTLIGCVFIENLADNDGGGLFSSAYWDRASATLIGCTFIGNTADPAYGFGGGAWSSDYATLTNCVFDGNTASGGGGMYNSWGSADVVNCTFSGNWAVHDGAGFFSYGLNSVATLTNSILWGNEDSAGMAGEDDQVAAWSGQLAVDYCCVQGLEDFATNGTGNIGDDPQLVDADGPDNIPGTEDDNLRLLPNSPCLDSGSNGALPADATDLNANGDTDEPIPFDLDGNPRIIDEVVDMGAYEGPNQDFWIVGDPVTVSEGVIPDKAASERGIGVFLVRLWLDPGGPVEVTVAHHAGDPDITVLIGSTLVFDSSNYSTLQPVILDAAEDDDWTNGTATIRVSALDIPCADVTAVEEENDPVPPVIFVDASASGANTGTSWADAFVELRDALSAIRGRAGTEEVWVAAGAYTPAEAGGDRTATFQLINEVALYGGFPASGGAWEERNLLANETSLSGDLNGDDDPDFSSNGENSYHVVTGSNVGSNGILDGFTVTGGNADGTGTDSHGHGGGMYNSNGSPTVTNCTFRGNVADRGLLSRGGGMYNDEHSSPTIVGCLFSGNSAGFVGGGLCNGLESSPTVTNCTFAGNSAAEEGGGMYNSDSSEPTLTNCILWGNTAASDPEIHGGSPTITYSCVQGGWPGEGNTDADPLFVDADGPDGIPGTNDDNLRLLLDSPCVEAGTNGAVPPEVTGDLDGYPRIADGDEDGDAIVDMGAYEHPLDCNTNGIPDAWDIASGTSADCNTNGRPDECDIQDGVSKDCQPNGIPDECDIAAGTSQDADSSGVPDECELARYVDDDAPLGGDGLTWDSAYRHLQDALAAAAADPKIVRIRLAAGVYKPDQDEAGNVTPGDRAATFQLLDGVALYGGYAGIGAADPDLRDVDSNATILSGDLNADDGPDFAGNGENSYHVVTGSGTTETAVLDGFTITAGNADGPYEHDQNYGGGMYNSNGSPTLANCVFTGNAANYAGAVYCYESSPTITNCTFSRNLALGYGGAVSCYFGSSPTITNCTFSRNLAYAGGGIDCYFSSSPTLMNCTFSGNSAGGAGGAVSCSYQNSPTITDCTFSRNSAYAGGGMDFYESSPTITNCTFSGNSAGGDGGAVNCYESSSTITNCTFIGNSADYGGAVNCHDSLTITNCTITGNAATGLGGGICASSLVLANSIIWDNVGANNTQIYCGSPIVTYSCIQGGWAGEGNIDVDPVFALADDPHLTPGSPCIDAGTNGPPGGLPSTDLDGNLRPLDGDEDGDAAADMGAYEFNPQAPSIAVSPSTINIVAVEGGLNPADRILFIRNGGGQTLNWEIAEDCAWLQADPDVGPAAFVTLSVDFTGLVPGEYPCVLPVVDEQAVNSPREVPVVLYVRAALHVPAQYSTIQAAIDAAQADEGVLVADGTYTGPGNKDLDFGGKATIVGSENGPETCVIDCEGDGRGFDFQSGETGLSVVDGFTITNGSGYEGGGARCLGSSPTFTNCVFSSNGGPHMVGGGMATRYGSSPTLVNCNFDGNSAGWGGGMYNFGWEGSNPTLINCTFRNNSADWSGGGMCEGGYLVNCMFIGNSARNTDAECVGGAMANFGGSPTLINCTFIDNQAEVIVTRGGPYTSAGGAISNNSGSSPRLTNCVFLGNSADYGGGMSNGLYGGECNPVLTNCIFSGNSASSGAGMHNNGSEGECRPTVVNCTFAGNSAESDGGGMSNTGSSPTLVNCSFSNNSSSDCAGGMYNMDSSPALVNCSFTGNSADYGGGMYNNIVSYPMLTNCILWGNTASSGAQIYGGSPTVSYSDIQGGWSGEGNIDADPLFVAGPLGCYYLSQTAAGQAQQSPCVDAGSDTAANLGLDARTTRRDEDADTGIVDMGYHSPITGAGFVRGDFDHEGDVDLADYRELNTCFTGPCDAPPCYPRLYTAPCCNIADFDDDGDVDLADFAGMQAAFTGEFPEPELIDSLPWDGSSLSADAFAVTATGGAVPTVDSIDAAANPTITVNLSEPIPIAEWTTLTCFVESTEGVEAEPTLDLAHLPCDVNQSGNVNISDATAFGDEFHGGQSLWLADTDRSGSVDDDDATEFENLFHGTGGFSQWNGQSLPGA